MSAILLSALPYLPMSNQLISRVETITPVLAEEYLRHNTKNRQLRKNLVSFYAEQMRKGQWMLNGEAVIFNEQGTLVDGQHRLSAVIEADKGIDMLVVRNADKDSFATIDSGVSRKVQDTFYVKGIPSASGVSAIIGRYLRLVAGLSIGKKVTGRKDANAMSRQDLLLEYAKDEDFWQEIVRFADSSYAMLRILAKSEIGGYVSYLIKAKGHDRDVVYGFFDELLRKDIPTSPMIAALRRRLINDRTSTTHMGTVYRQQLITKIWNYHIQGKSTTYMRWNEEQEGKKDFI